MRVLAVLPVLRSPNLFFDGRGATPMSAKSPENRFLARKVTRFVRGTPYIRGKVTNYVLGGLRRHGKVTKIVL
jgi:hypothetical protein